MMSEYQDVWPKTLVMRGGTQNHDVYVLGGTEENVFVAMFVDGKEAEAWIQASKQFGDMIRGRVYVAKGEQGRVVPGGTDGSSGGSG
jgi:hypothetical protein